MMAAEGVQCEYPKNKGYQIWLNRREEFQMSLDQLQQLGRPALRSEVAKLLDCDVRTVDKAIKDGTIRSFRIGRRVFVPLDPLVDLLRTGTST